MRIIAGKYRGRTLSEFRGEEIRPTADRVKESVFQILAPRLSGARVLDLFCGSGALGIESLSRGAREAVFNDVRKESLAVLRKNLAKIDEPCRVRCLDFRSLLCEEREPFDLIFSDPPYREDFLSEILSLTEKRDLLVKGGLVVHESEREEQTPFGWELLDERRYGRTFVRFYQRARNL